MKTIEKQFGQRVRKLRLARSLSQEKLAFKSGMHRTYIGGIERGERNPSLKNIAAIAKALEVTLSQLLLFDNLTLQNQRRVKTFKECFGLKQE